MYVINTVETHVLQSCVFFSWAKFDPFYFKIKKCIYLECCSIQINFSFWISRQNYISQNYKYIIIKKKSNLNPEE